jgi:hypothetical protein
MIELKRERTSASKTAQSVGFSAGCRSCGCANVQTWPLAPLPVIQTQLREAEAVIVRLGHGGLDKGRSSSGAANSKQRDEALKCCDKIVTHQSKCLRSSLE